jgi:hypothetical protein
MEEKTTAPDHLLRRLTRGRSSRQCTKEHITDSVNALDGEVSRAIRQGGIPPYCDQLEIVGFDISLRCLGYDTAVWEGD